MGRQKGHELLVSAVRDHEPRVLPAVAAREHHSGRRESHAVYGQPRNFNTHHRAAAEDLLVGWEAGFRMRVGDADVTVRIMMACVIGDGPGRSRVFAGTNSDVQLWPTF